MSMNINIDKLHEALMGAEARGCRYCTELFYTAIGDFYEEDYDESESLEDLDDYYDE